MNQIGCSKHLGSPFTAFLWQQTKTNLLCLECITELTPSDQVKVVSLKKASQMPLYLLTQIANQVDPRLNFFSELTDAQINNEAKKVEKNLNSLIDIQFRMKKEVHDQAKTFIEERKNFQDKIQKEFNYDQYLKKVNILIANDQFEQTQFEEELNYLLNSSQKNITPSLIENIVKGLDIIQRKIIDQISFKNSQETIITANQIRQSFIDFQNKLYYEPQFLNASSILKENIFLKKITDTILKDQDEAKIVLRQGRMESNGKCSDQFKFALYNLHILQTETGNIFGFKLLTQDVYYNNDLRETRNEQLNFAERKELPFIFSLKNNEFYRLRPDKIKEISCFQNQVSLLLSSDLQIDSKFSVTSNLGQCYELNENHKDVSKIHLLGSENGKIVAWEILPYHFYWKKKE